MFTVELKNVVYLGRGIGPIISKTIGQVDAVNGLGLAILGVAVFPLLHLTCRRSLVVIWPWLSYGTRFRISTRY